MSDASMTVASVVLQIVSYVALGRAAYLAGERKVLEDWNKCIESIVKEDGDEED